MKFIVSLFVIVSYSAFSQLVNYNDVGVIINDNSQESIDIANYFQGARNIPAQNMIHINAPTTEQIDSATFQSIRAQIENYLISNNLADSLNYLVTTKGVPLKINSGCVVNPGTGSCSSFDSDLALILGTYSSFILGGQVINPYHGSTKHFSRDSVGIYLVTRLTGYTKQDVYKMIDHSGPNTGVDQAAAEAIIDMNNATGGDSAYFVDVCLQPAYDTITGYNWNTQFDHNTNPLLNQNQVFTYLSTGHGPLNNVNLNYTWLFGSFSAMSTCNTAATFDSASNPSNDFLVADLIASGCTAGYGHVNCIFFGQIISFDILVDRYLDPNNDYNLAESYYMAEKTLSWQSVIVGDPKASIYISNVASVEALAANSITIYPNPTADQFRIHGINQLTGEISLSITAIDGSVVEIDKEVTDGKSYQLTASGVYFVNVYADGNHLGTYRVVKR